MPSILPVHGSQLHDRAAGVGVSPGSPLLARYRLAVAALDDRPNIGTLESKQQHVCHAPLRRRPSPLVASAFLPLTLSAKEELLLVQQQQQQKKPADANLSSNPSRNGYSCNNNGNNNTGTCSSVSGSGTVSSSIRAEKERSRVSFSFDLLEDETENEYENGDGNGNGIGEDGSNRTQSPLDSLDSLRIFLPMKRGLSRHYDGKSQSFSSLSEVRTLKDLAKPDYGRLAKKNRTF